MWEELILEYEPSLFHDMMEQYFQFIKEKYHLLSVDEIIPFHSWLKETRELNFEIIPPTTGNLEKIKENEFRKNVTLKVKDKEEWIDINMDKLKEYSIIMDNFTNKIKTILS